MEPPEVPCPSCGGPLVIVMAAESAAAEAAVALSVDIDATLAGHRCLVPEAAPTAA